MRYASPDERRYEIPRQPIGRIYVWSLIGLLAFGTPVVHAQSKPADAVKQVDPVPVKPAADFVKPDLSPIKTKLPHQLLEAVDEYLAGNQDWAKTVGIPSDYVFDDKVLVDVFAEESQLSEPLADLVTAFGGEVRGELTKSSLEATVPIKALPYLAQDFRIRKIRLSRPVVLLTQTQGVYASNAINWKTASGIGSAHGISGRGVKIAVIDAFDFELLGNQLTEGSTEIPPAKQVQQFTIMKGTESAHGNNVLEIIYDFAPAAEYVLINTALSQASIRASFDLAIAQDVDIINLSIATPDAADGVVGVGSVSEKIREAYRAGITVINSAGNHAEEHWAGGFRPTENPNLLDWNFNQLNGAGREILAGHGPVYVNPLYSGTCIPNGFKIVIGATREGDDSGPYARHDRTWGMRLMRQGSADVWHTFEYAGGEATTYAPVFLSIVKTASSNGSTYGVDGELISTRTPTGPSPGCPTGSARYGLKVMRQLEPGRGSGGPISSTPYFLSIFTPRLSLAYSVPQSSLSSESAIPYSFSVGAAVCNNTDLPGNDCRDLSIADYSSRGPVLGPMNSAPLFRDPVALRDDIFNVGASTIKPDAVSFSHVRTSLSPAGLGFTGTSASAPHVTGMAALLLQRYPNLRGDPYTTKVALSQIASVRDSRDTDLAAAGYTANPSYDYGRGLLRFQIEDHLELRGRPNNTQVGRTISSTPASSPPDGSIHFTDGYDDTVRARFKDRFDRPIVFPGLIPKIQLAGCAPDTLASDLVGGDALFYDAGRYYLIGDLYMGFTTGYYSFPGLQITRFPTSACMGGLAPSYRLEVGARALDGTVVPSISTIRSADFDLSR